MSINGKLLTATLIIYIAVLSVGPLRLLVAETHENPGRDCDHRIAIVYDEDIPGARWFAHQLSQVLVGQGYRVDLLGLSPSSLTRASHNACISVLISHFTVEGIPSYSDASPVVDDKYTAWILMAGGSRWIIIGCNLSTGGVIDMLAKEDMILYAPKGPVTLDPPLLESTATLIASSLPSPPPAGGD